MKTTIKTRLKKIICEMLSLCLCIALTAILLMTSVSFGFFQDNVFLSAMCDMDYYEELADQLQNDLEQVVGAYHIPAKAVEGVIHADQVYLDGYENLTHAIRGKAYEADVTHVTTDLRACIDAYATEHEIQAVQAVKTATDSITHAMSQEYGRMLSFPFADAYYGAKQTCEKLSRWIYAIGGAVILICSALLLLLHQKRYRGMRQIDHAVLAATISSGVLGAFASHQIMNMEILSENNAYAGMISNYFEVALKKGIWSVIVGAAMWFVLLIITHEMREKRI
ncbi:MAG: hypothetical protein MSA09_11525 [Lachnospiraceae bacterium]|nr:hypothetical protein [Lachnospiraceae bacterium]